MLVMREVWDDPRGYFFVREFEDAVELPICYRDDFDDN